MSSVHHTTSLTPEQAINRLSAYYDGAVRALREAIAAFIERGEIPDDAARAASGFVYPALHVSWDGEGQPAERTRAYGRFNHPGHYVTTITRPELFRGYLLEQLTLLVREYGARIEVHPSQQEIPYPYVIDGAELALDRMMSAALARHFPIPNLAHIGDETADGALLGQQDAPLSHFDALRTDFSLARLRHYTGTPPEHVQPYILFTNYSRYVDEFVRWACRQIASPNSVYCALSGAGGIYIDADNVDSDPLVSDLAWKNHQMPADHLMREDGSGITLVNIGVGPANAKTICDHLAVLRPHAWLMIGHCGGLRQSQIIGDYVLAHAYLRDDHVLDAVLPPDIPIPSIAEVQRALYDATKQISGMPGEQVKQRLRTGRSSPPTIVTGSCVTAPLPAALISAERWRSTWRAPPSPLRATASASRTAPYCASRTSRYTVRSSCPHRPTASTKGPSPNISRSASMPWIYCGPRAIACTHVSYAPLTSRPSANPERGGGNYAALRLPRLPRRGTLRNTGNHFFGRHDHLSAGITISHYVSGQSAACPAKTATSLANPPRRRRGQGDRQRLWLSRG